MHSLIKILAFISFHLVLKHLIRNNYRKRINGESPDVWYWADELCSGYGHFVND